MFAYCKRVLVLAFVSLSLSAAYALDSSNWTSDEFYAANAAAEAPFLTQTEKDVILFINLVRLYPAKFAEHILKAYDYVNPSYANTVNKNSNHFRSLVSELKNMRALQILPPDESMYNYANCWAVEMGENGLKGHGRISCPNGGFDECCCYGRSEALDIVVAMLLDEGNESLENRRNLLNPDVKCVGVSIASHISASSCVVIDLGYKAPEDPNFYRPAFSTSSYIALFNLAYAEYFIDRAEEMY